MNYKISNIKIPIQEMTEDILHYISNKLHLKGEDISDFKIINKSIDARKSRQGELFFIYTIELHYPKDLTKIKCKWQISKLNEKSIAPLKHKAHQKSFHKSPIIVGFGPAGLFAALKLAQLGANPIVLERGQDVLNRKKDIDSFWNNGQLGINSNVQFGEGGAGSFSDGKLTSRVKDPLNREILQCFVDHGAPEEILYLHKPHVGTDILRDVIKSIRKEIISLGGQVLFNSCMTNILIEGQRIRGVEVNNKDSYETDHLILAIGHSARDTYELINKKKASLEAKAFAIGLRIEHPQVLINKAQYGEHAESSHLKAADYQLTYHDQETGRGVYSFCMCPGGLVIASSSEEGGVVTNGMSYYSRNEENANSAIVVNIRPDDFQHDPIKGIAFQRKYENLAFELGGKNYNAPIQLVGDFLEDKESIAIGDVKPTYRPGVRPSNLALALPDYVSNSIKHALPYFNQKLKGFSSYDAVLTGVETRTSSPLRILRDKVTRESLNIKGLYPIGEGAGYAGGIMSAALDGLKCAYFLVESGK